MWNGLEPVAGDVDPQDLLHRRRGRPRRLILRLAPSASRPYLRPARADIESLETLAREHDLKLVFDAAHGLGAVIEIQPCGSFG